MPAARGGKGPAIRRFPGLTREDVDVLRVLAHDDPAKAREFERYLKRGSKLQRQFESGVVLFDSHDLDALADREIARWQRGAGGGRKRNVEEAARP